VLVSTPQAQFKKVFCFFFSKKKRFLLPQDRVGKGFPTRLIGSQQQPAIEI
jgi:hypothetical protein